MDYIVEIPGARLDQYLTACTIDYSRARLQQLIKDGEVKVNGRPAKASYKVESGDVISLNEPAPTIPLDVTAEDIPLDILYQDTDLVVLNKPVGLVVHPAAGHHSGTLVNALLHHVSDLSGIGGELRPGIVHRLDKDTSGLMLVAKNDIAHRALAEMIEKREVIREYRALAWGNFDEDTFTVDAPLGRHQHDRQRMAVLAGENVTARRRHAVTHFTVAARGTHVTELYAKLDTGRTHQIRVHLHYIGHPVVGDPLYMSHLARQLYPLLNSMETAAIAALPGQALHACRLSFPHPRTGEIMRYEVAPPATYMRTYEALIKSNGTSG